MMPSPSHKPPLPHRRTLNVFVLAMLSLAVVVSLRNLPLTAEYGLSSIFFYFVATVCFMIPYALVSAELASGWPKGGGVYIWVREALGERWGFFAIWMQWFHSMTWFPAMLAFIGAGIAFLFDPALATNKIYLLSVILGGFWAVTLFNFFGVKASSFFTTFCVIVGTILPGAVLIYLGINWVVSGMPLSIEFSYRDLMPDFSKTSNLVFLGGIFLALAGLEANANLAREVKNPQKNYPRAIFIASLLVLLILIFGSLSIAVAIPKSDINLVSGIFDAFREFFAAHNLSWLVPIIAFFTVLGALGELNAWTITGVKGLFVTTEYGSLPPIFHKMNKNQTPINLMLFQGCLVSLTALVFILLPDVNLSFWMLSALSSQMYLLVYLMLFIAGVRLRYSKPEVHRAYRVPFKNIGIWIFSVVGIIASLFAFATSLFPPTFHLAIENLFTYEALLIGILAVSIALPLIIYSLRQPHWKLIVLEEIREEIRRSVH